METQTQQKPRYRIEYIDYSEFLKLHSLRTNRVLSLKYFAKKHQFPLVKALASNKVPLDKFQFIYKI